MSSVGYVGFGVKTLYFMLTKLFLYFTFLLSKPYTPYINSILSNTTNMFYSVALITLCLHLATLKILIMFQRNKKLTDIIIIV